MRARGVSVAIGVWLMAAPAVLGYGGDAATNDRIFGPLAAAVAFVALSSVTRPVRWVNLPIGAWLMVAPFVLRYGGESGINSVISGIVLIALSTVKGRVKQEFGGGWRAAFKTPSSARR
jgi:hypothetical protein